jgi:oxygen-independent coproporphyrinogen III oxidase
VPGAGEYVERVEAGASPVAERRRLSAAERLGDAVFTGLRLSAGVDLEAIARRHGTDLWRCYGEHLQPYVEAGLLVRERDRLRLTRRGMLLSNEVMAVFV